MKRIVGIIAVLMMLPASTAFGAGLWLYEHGTPDLGTASAGRAALANDASTAAHNPAGMANLDRSQLLVGVMPLHIDAKFNSGPETTTTGSDGVDPGGTTWSGGVSYVHRMNDEWSAGISAGSYFGLGVDYGEDWVGRYFITQGEILTFSLSPTVSYKINDQFSIGGGLNVFYAELNQEAAVRRPFNDDGRLKLEEDDVSVGAIIGGLYKLSENTRFGMTYATKVELEFDDIVTVSGTGSDYPWLNSLKVDYGLTIPQAAMFSGYHALSEKLAVMGNIGWQDWSDFGKADLMVTSDTQTDLTIDGNYDDTWHFAVGLQYRLDDPWLLSGGFAYDTPSVKDEYRTVAANVDRQLRFGTGIQYDCNEDVTVGLAYEYVDGGSASIDQTRGIGGPLELRLQGEYDPNVIHFFNVNLIWRY